MKITQTTVSIPLFKFGKFIGASKTPLDWKIECDALGDDDWECLAQMAMKILPAFRTVQGVPRGGWPLAEKLQKFRTSSADLNLVVDDVWTTGHSIRNFVSVNKIENPYFLVVFLRNMDDAPFTDYLISVNPSVLRRA